MKLAYSRTAQFDTLRSTGWRIVTFKDSTLAVAFQQIESGKVFVKAWRGKADKPAFYYSFRDMSRAELYVKDFAEQVRKSEESRKNRKNERAAKRASLKASDHWAVGDVIYNSWGYEQTNVDWYQVVEVKAKSIVIREIAANCNDNGGPYGGQTAPRRNDFVGNPLLKQIHENGYVSFQFGCGTKWDGRAKHCSSYH